MSTIDQFNFGSAYDKAKITDAVNTSEASVERILTANASPQEIVEWYYAYDPLEIQQKHAFRKSARTGNMDPVLELGLEQHINAELYEAAAATLLASVYFPAFFEDQNGSWLEELDKIYEPPKGHAIINSENTPSPPEIILFCLGQDKSGFTPDELTDLMIAAEMLYSASGLRSIVTSTAKAYTDLKNEPYPLSTSINTVAAETDRSIARRVFHTVLKETAHEEDIHSRSMYLSAMLNLTGLNIADFDSLKQKGLSFYREDGSKFETREELLMPLVNALDAYCTDKDTALQKQRENGYTPRGLVHEAIWFIDAHLLNKIHDYPANIFPSTSNQDMPRIGYPELNHGFDMMINYRGVDFVAQLKSKPNATERTKVNPAIDIVTEKNFQEFNPTNMRRKLQWYREVISGKISLDDSPEVKKRLLTSAVEYFDYMEEEGQKELFIQRQLEKKLQQHAVLAKTVLGVEKKLGTSLNREQRRKIARQTKKQTTKLH